MRTPRPHLAIALASLVVVLAAGAAACRGAPEGGRADAGSPRPARGRPAVARGELAIGVALNPQRAGMESIERGVDLAVATLNAELAATAGAEGTVRFVVKRTPRQVTSAVEAAGLLRDDPAVVGIVGDAESGRTLDALPIIEDAAGGGDRAVVAVSPTATSPALAGRSAWLFRVCPSDEAASRAAAHFALDSLGARRAAVIYRNDSYGRDWTTAFARAFRERGGQVVVRDPYVAGVTEWAALAGFVGQTGADVVLFPGSAEDAADLVRALRAAGVAAPVLGGDPVGALDGQREFAGVRYLTAFLADRLENPEARAFATAFERRYQVPPDFRAAMGYDAAMVIGRAALAAGGDRRAVRDWIAGVGTSRPALPGVAGAIGFDRRHDVVERPVYVATVTAGPARAGAAKSVAAAPATAAPAGRATEKAK